MTHATLPRPKVFVGSSVEGLSIAYAVQENLEFDTEVTVWSQGVFEPSQTTIETLDKEIGRFDFAIFVFTPDDVLKIRGAEFTAVRDNVQFELGLSIGRLGRLRSVIVMPREKEPIRLPTDLLGVAPVTYNPVRTDGNLAAALGPACNQIRRVISHHGPRAGERPGTAVAIESVASGLSTELREHLSQVLVEQNQRIEAVVKTFDSNFRSLLGIEARAGNAADPASAMCTILTDVLSRDARSLLRILRRHHLTVQQYEDLSRTSSGPALEELSNAGLLVLMTGFEDGKDVPVYYFPRGLADLLQQATGQLPASRTAAHGHMALDLHQVGYPVIVDDDESPPDNHGGERKTSPVKTDAKRESDMTSGKS